MARFIVKTYNLIKVKNIKFLLILISLKNDRESIMDDLI